MASNLRKLTDLSQWKPRARQRALLLAAACGPLALVMALMTFMVTTSALTRLPKPVDVYRAINDGAVVSNFARKSLLLWLGGTSTSTKSLMARSSAAHSIELSELPFEVRWIDPAGVQRWQGADAVQWRVTLDATLVAPGSAAAQINRFAVTVLDHDGDYQLLMWPVIVSPDITPFTVVSKYTVAVGDKNPLHDQLQRFATAYLTSPVGSTSMGQYVSAKFHGSAIADTPYSSATVEQVKSAAGDPQLSTAKPGTQLKVLVRVKASASTKTWSVMDLPLRVSMSENRTWLVDGFDAPIGWGDITSE